MPKLNAAVMYSKKNSVRDVMRAFSCDFYTARGLIAAAGGTLLGSRRVSKLSKQEIVELYKTKGIPEIARLNGTSQSIIIRVLKEYDVERGPRGNNSIRVPPITHGHCQQARRFGMNPYRYVRLTAILRLGGRCVRCGEEDLNVLDLNHINGEKAPQKNKNRRLTDVKYEEHIQILAGVKMPHIEVACCNCNRRHEVERGNIPPIPEEFLCLHRSQLKSSGSGTRSSTVKRSNAGCNLSAQTNLKSQTTKRSPIRRC